MTRGASGRNLLRRNADFRLVWGGESVSRLGTAVTSVAIPLTAIVTLDASPGQLGVLSASLFAPTLLVTLFAGAWADRVRRRPLLIAANLGRAITLAVVPLLASTGLLTIPALCVIAFATGALTALFDVAYLAYLPSLVDEADLVEANGKVQASTSVAQTAGPGLGGILTQMLTAPVTLLVDSATYLTALVSLLLVRRPERTTAGRDRRSVYGEITDGFRAMLGHRELRMLATQSAWFNFFEQVIITLFFLFGLRQLGLSETALGLAVTLGGVGSILGAVTAARIGSRFGRISAMAGGMMLACLPLCLVPAATGPGAWPVAMLWTAFFASGAGLTVYNVHAVAYRQQVTPPELLGRVTAAYRFVSFGTIPLGGLLGGITGEMFGLRQTLAVAAAGLVLGAILSAHRLLGAPRV